MSDTLQQVLMQCCDLYCERDERVLFRGLTFCVHAGDIVQIEGPNGAGKTTLMRALAGLSHHVEGHIHWRERAILDEPAQFHADVVVIGHGTGVKLALTPRENLRWLARVRGLPLDGLESVIDRALVEVGLSAFADQPAQALSAGQKRRIALARLFVEPATLWVLDEPFAAIDKDGVAALEALLVAHAKAGGAVIVVTHHDMNLQARIDDSGAPVHQHRLRLEGRKGQWQWQ